MEREEREPGVSRRTKHPCLICKPGLDYGAFLLSLHGAATANELGVATMRVSAILQREIALNPGTGVVSPASTALGVARSANVGTTNCWWGYLPVTSG